MAAVTYTGAIRTSFLRELGYLRKNRWDRVLTLWFPILVLFVTWWIFSAGVARKLPIAVVDADHSFLSRQFVRMLDASPGISIAFSPEDLQSAWSLVRSGEVWTVVVIPHNAERAVKTGKQATLYAYYNAQFPTASNLALRDIGSAASALGTRLAVSDAARFRSPLAVRKPPIAVQSTTLFNPQGNYEWMLVSIIHPAVLHLLLSMCVISAVGRELRDKTADAWLASSGGRMMPALAGKLIPYVGLFTFYGFACLVLLSGIRGWHIQGNLYLIMAGYLLMMLSYAVIGVLVVGLTRSMSISLALVNVYAGASIAFSGGVFPTIGAPLATRIWSAILPYTTYLRLQIQQMYMASPMNTSLIQIFILILFVAVPLWPAFLLLDSAARKPRAWGHR